jgi:hypothetical protein
MINYLAVQPGVRSQLALGDEAGDRSLDIDLGFHDSLLQQPPLDDSAERILGCWIRRQVVQDTPLNWRFTFQSGQTKGSTVGEHSPCHT